MFNSHPERINFDFECSQFGANSFTNLHLNKRQDHFSSLCISKWIFFLLGNPNNSNITQFSYIFNVDSFDNSSSSWPKTERWVLHPSMPKGCCRHSNSSVCPTTFQNNCSGMFKVACCNSINLNVINCMDFRELSNVLQHFTLFSFIFTLPESAWMKTAIKIDYKKTHDCESACTVHQYQRTIWTTNILECMHEITVKKFIRTTNV